MPVNLRGLDDNAKKTSIEVLNACIADGVVLARALKQAHWNMKGRNFQAVHELLDEIKLRVDDNVDELAERVQQLDGMARGTVHSAAQESRLQPYPTDVEDVSRHVSLVCDLMRDYGARLREGIDTTDQAGDPNTADILTAASNQADKDLWFLASHLD